MEKSQLLRVLEQQLPHQHGLLEAVGPGVEEQGMWGGTCGCGVLSRGGWDLWHLEETEWDVYSACCWVA